MRLVSQYFNTSVFMRIFLAECYRALMTVFYGACLLASVGLEIKQPIWWLYAVLIVPAVIAAEISYKR